MHGRLTQSPAMALRIFNPPQEFAGSTVKKWDLEEDCKDDMNEELWGSLPLALVEEVISRLPFKLLFQCRVLSRAWRWNGGVRSTRKKHQHLTSRFFEKAISLVSSKWPTYYPVYVFQDGLVGYSSESKTWEKIFDLNMFNFLSEDIDTSTLTSCAGALVCFGSVNHLSNVDIKVDSGVESWSYKPLENEIYVANVVTRKWRRLPPRPTMQRPNIMHLIPVGSTEYKLILLTQLENLEGSRVPSTITTQIYYSSNNTWTEKTFKIVLPKLRTSLYNFVYLDGCFYIAAGSTSRVGPALIIIHNVENGTWKTRFAPRTVDRRFFVKLHVLLCDSELMLVARVVDHDGSREEPQEPVIYRDMFMRAHNFLIFKLDAVTKNIKEVSRCPREKLVGVAIDQVLANGDTIYFGGKYICKSPMMMYNVRENEWAYHTSDWEIPKSRLPSQRGFFYIQKPEQYYWTHSALQPGLNPFAEV